MKEENLFDSHPTAGKPFDQQRLGLKDDFTAKRGYWHTFWEDFLALDPEFFEAYTEFSSVPWTRKIDGITGHAGALANQVKKVVRRSQVSDVLTVADRTKNSYTVRSMPLRRTCTSLA